MAATLIITHIATIRSFMILTTHMVMEGIMEVITGDSITDFITRITVTIHHIIITTSSMVIMTSLMAEGKDQALIQQNGQGVMFPLKVPYPGEVLMFQVVQTHQGPACRHQVMSSPQVQEEPHHQVSHSNQEQQLRESLSRILQNRAVRTFQKVSTEEVLRIQGLNTIQLTGATHPATAIQG